MLVVNSCVFYFGIQERNFGKIMNISKRVNYIVFEINNSFLEFGVIHCMCFFVCFSVMA